MTAATYTASGQPVTRNENETWGYDNRLRVDSYLNMSTASSSTINYGYSLGYWPNGNVKTAIETSGSKTWTWNYTYDNVNRLLTATNEALSYGCQETYDAYGNRTSQAPYGGSGYSCGSISFTFTGNGTSNNNRIDGYCYDASGNLLDEGPCPASGNHTFTYDAEGRIATAVNGAIINTYGADGIRTSTQASGGTPTNFVYDYDGSIISHYTGSVGALQPVWINGQHFGTFTPNASGSISGAANLTLSAVDWLGTERMRADDSNNLKATFCNLPFGDQPTTCLGSDPNPSDATHFTGKERDTESGLDYFGARYYGS